MSARDKGKAFLTELLAHVPEADRADLQAKLEANEQAMSTLGAATLRQSDYSRSRDEIDAYHQQLDDWYAENAPKLSEYEKLKAGLAAPTPPATPATPPGLSKAEIEEMFAARERAAIAAIVHTNELSSKHFKTFGEPLDIQALMKDPQIGEIGLPGVYQKVYQPKYDEIAKKAEDLRINAEVDKRLAERARANPQMPYPVSGHEPSVLDGIEAQLRAPLDPSKPLTAPVTHADVVDQAVAQYHDALNRQGVPA